MYLVIQLFVGYYYNSCYYDITCILHFSLYFVDWSIMEKHYKTLCNLLPCNYLLTFDKLKTKLQLLKDGDQLSKLITSSSTEVRKINEKIITCLLVKLCYNGSSTNLVRLCDVMDELIDSTDALGRVHQIRCGKCLI